MKVVLNFHLGTDVRMSVPEGMLAALRARFPHLGFVAADDAGQLAHEVADAEIFCGFAFPPELAARAPRLRWIQCLTAGVEESVTGALRDRDVIVTSGAGIAAAAIAEHVLGIMLCLCRNLHVAIRLQEQARWERPTVIAGTGAGIREFSGSRVAILGLGPIGRAVAERAAALGATVRGMRRRPRPTAPTPFEAVAGPDGLPALLQWADFVVVAVPRTAATEGMIGGRELGSMRPDAFLVNVARGSVIDEAALTAALEQGGIAGAGLDVCTTEPLPSSSPLWRLPNVLLTPHVAGATPGYFDRAVELFADNLARFLDGRPLVNAVDKKLGYPIHTE